MYVIFISTLLKTFYIYCNYNKREKEDQNVLVQKNMNDCDTPLEEDKYIVA